MNTSYRSIWSPALGAWVAVSEIACARGKRASSTVAALALVLTAGGVAAQDHAYTTAADAGPLVTAPAGANPLGITLSTGAGIAATQSSVISGALGVVKEGAGTLALTGVNTYQGGTYLNAGTLQIGADANLGAATGGLSFNGGTLAFTTATGLASARAIAVQAGGATFDAAGTQGNTFSGPLSGTGKLTFLNSAPTALGNEDVRFTLSSSNNTGFTGPIQVGTAGGVGAPGRTNLLVTGSGTLGTGPVAVGYNAEVAFIGAGASANNLAITVGESSDVLGNNSGINFDTGAKAGTATLTTQGAGAYVTFNGNASADHATIVSHGGRVRFNGMASGGNAHITTVGGLVSLAGSGDMSGASVVTDGGSLVVAYSSGGVSLGDLSGSGSVVLGAQALTLGALNQSGTLSGVISDTGPQWSDKNGNSFSDAVTATGGQLIKIGTGTLTLSGANTYTGATTVTAGTLRAGAADTFSAASAHNVAAGATLDTAGFNQRLASLANSGTVSLVSATPGSTLTVNGAYVGNGGVLRLGTFLGDSTSASDRLVLDGPAARASGTTSLQITQVGGLGALTTGNGINVITAQNGATTDANAFTLAGGHVDAGAFEYRLHDGDASGAGENWYLRSTTNVVPPVITPVDPVKPVDPVTPVTPVTPATPPVTRPTYRAEVPLYAALPGVLRQGDLAMLSTLHRRVGDEASTGNGSAAAIPNTTRAWGRLIGGNTTITQNGTTSPESRTSIGGFQTGVDLFANAEWNAGLYVGKLRSDADVRGVYGLNLGQSYAGSLRADTTYLGGYATWANANGLYVDTVLQYGLQDISGTSVNRIGASPDGTSLTASVEVGQRFAMGSNWAIEPQAQLIYNRQNLGNSWIGGLTSVEQDTANAVIGRLGVRVTGDFSTGVGRIQPYARVNLWHGFKGTDRTGFLSPAGITSFDNQIGYTSVEVAAGATWALTPTTSVYGELGSLMKAGGQTKVKSSVQGSVGVKLRF